MHLLDTDTLTHLHAQHPRVVERLARLDDPDVGTTVVTKAELLHGRIEFVLKATTGAELLRAQYLLARTEELLAQIPVVALDEAAAIHFDRLKQMRGLKKVGHADLLVASTALAHRAVVVTRNVRHFRQVSGLQVVNWVD